MSANKLAIHLHGLHPGQERVLAEAKRFNWLCAGRRWRKTSLCASISLEGLGPWKGALYGSWWLWGAPTHDQVRYGWDEIKRACADVLDYVQFHETHRTIYLPSGGRVYFRSLSDPDSARGLTVTGGVVIDEYQDVPPDAWPKVIQPMLIDTGGCAFFIFTPSGHNHAYQQWQAATHDPEQVCWRAPLLGARVVDGKLVREPHPYENPSISWHALLDIWNDPNMDERTFRQEYLAEFLADGGGIFRAEVIDRAATSIPPDTPQSPLGLPVDERAILTAFLNKQPLIAPIREYVMGVDVGRHHDFTWITILDVAEQREVASERFSMLEYDLQKARIVESIRRWRPASLAIEINGNEAFVEDLGKTPTLLDDDGKLVPGSEPPIFPVRMTNPTKSTMIADLVVAFERSEIRIINDPIRKAELVAFEGKRSKNSTVTLYGAPDGMHDDGVMSLALAWHALLKGRVYYAGSLY